MTNPNISQTLSATRGILKLRGMLDAGRFTTNDADDLAALCDYTEAQIESAARGRSAGGASRAAKLSAKRRSAIARKGAAARWKKTTEEK